MSKVFAVYVSGASAAQTNLRVGLDNLVWGWRDSVLDRKGHRATAEAMQPGDLLVMGTLGPNPRVAEGGWEGVQLGRALLLRLTSSLYESTDPVWPDDVTGVMYPNRIDFEVLYDVQAPEHVDLDPAALEALRWSANTQGSVVAVGLAEDQAPQFEVAAPEEPEPSQLAHTGAFDALAQVLVRREQRKLRKQKFGEASEVTCAICGKTYPARLIRAAHVKKRSMCGPDELLDLSNVMAACALGCDELFEHGYIAVDSEGAVTGLKASSGDLAAVVGQVSGAVCQAYNATSSKYFEWHRTFHSDPPVGTD